MIAGKPGTTALRATLLALAVFALPGCLGRMVLPDVADAASAAGGVILVGKIRLEPPLIEGEQIFAGNVVGEDRLKNTVVLLTSTTATSREPVQPSFGELNDAINVRFDQPFFLKAPPHGFNITGGLVTLTINSQRADYAYLPGRLQIPIKAGDKAVYIGTVIFHRNDFFDITRVEIRDDFAAAERAYRKQVQGAPALRKALAKKLPAGK